MRFFKYGLIISLIVAALGIYLHKTYLIVCFGGSTVVFGLVLLIVGYFKWVERDLWARLQAGEPLTPQEVSLLSQLQSIRSEWGQEAPETRSGPSQRSPFFFDYTPPARAFVEQGEKFVDQYEKKASFVPFQSYRPTYRDMTKAQQRWYFYWRHQVRQGHYPQTSLSYILLLVYELINNIGTTDAQAGYEQLRRLWLNYRETQSQLDRILPDWLADYIVVNKLQIDPLTAYETVYVRLDPKATVIYHDVDLVLPAYLKNSAGDALAQMPLLLIEALTDHRITASKFYEAGYADLLVDTLPRVIAQVDLYLKQTGKGIFDRYRPKKKAILRHYPFEGAIYAGPDDLITIAKVYPYAQHQPLRYFLTAVVKHAENLLRQQHNHRGRLRVDDLEKDIQMVIEQAIFGQPALDQPAEFQLGQPAGSSTGASPIPAWRPKRSGKPGQLSRLERLAFAGFFDDDRQSFVEQAKALADYREDRADFIGFDHSHPAPTYAMMILPQLKWYFYWRDQVRQGNYRPAGQGYVFVYLRELIHTIGVEDPMTGYTQLCNIWRHYHETHQAINHYARLWAADYIVVNQLPLHPLHIYAEPAMQTYVLRHQPDFAVALYLERPFDEWPLPLIERLIDHQLTKNPFYQSGQADLVAQYIPQTITQVDHFLKKRAGKGIFEQYQPPKPEVIQRPPFNDGAYEGDSKPITIGTIYPYTHHQPLRDFLTAVVKYAENHLRDLKEYRGRLRVTGLEAEIKTVIDRFIAQSRLAINPPPPKPKVEIDLSRIEALQKESDHVFDLLQIETDAEVTEITEIEDKIDRTNTIKSAMAEDNDGGDLQPPVETLASPPPGEFEFEFEDEAWTDLAAQLTLPQIDILGAIISAEAPMAAIRQIAAGQHTMPAVILDSINELAQDSIGDILIETDPDPHIIDPYYVEMVEYLIGQRRLHNLTGPNQE